MKSIDLAEVAALTPHLVPGSHEPLLVTKDGSTLAAVIPVTGDDVEQLVLNLNPTFQNVLERSDRRLKEEGGLSPEEVRRKLGLL